MDECELDERISNGFLRLLPAGTLARLRPHLEPVELARHQRLFAPGDEVASIYFISRGLVSLVKATDDGRLVEVGSVGVEGAVSLAGMFGGGRALLEAIVQIPGSALRMSAATLREISRRDEALKGLLRHYLADTINQIAQIAACNRLHNLEERCCRWLLTAHDSAGGDTFQVTHELLAQMLGVQRPGVSIAARRLQDEGLISYHNGRVTIRNRAGLMASACACYGVGRRLWLDHVGEVQADLDD